jgi:hypothetical protein
MLIRHSAKFNLNSFCCLSSLVILIASGCDTEEVANMRTQGGGLDQVPMIGTPTPSIESVFSIGFDEPNSKVFDADDEWEIEISVSGIIDPKGTWSVYYTTGSTKLIDAKLIRENIPLSTKKIAWNTSELEPGQYLLLMTYANNNIRNEVFARNPISVSHPNPGNRPPVLTLHNFLGYQVFKPNDEKIIRFTAVDPDNDPITIKIEWSQDDGQTYTDITNQEALVHNNAGEYQFTWALDLANYNTATIKNRIKLTASDDRQKSAVKRSLDPFGLANSIMTFDGGMRDLLTEKCAPCHTQSNVNGSLDALNVANIEQVRERRNSIATAVLNGSMPQGSSLPDEDKKNIVLFSWGGAPQQ